MSDLQPSAPLCPPECANGVYPWYALRVYTTAESRTKLLLEHRGHDIFLPTYIDSRKYSDRVKKVNAPLFPGYLFCRLDVTRRTAALSTPGVVSIVGIGSVPHPLDESEIEAIRIAVSSGASLRPWPYLRAGDRVRIEFGPLAGLEGILVRPRGVDRLVISVGLLQRSIAVEVDRNCIRPVG